MFGLFAAELTLWRLRRVKNSVDWKFTRNLYKANVRNAPESEIRAIFDDNAEIANTLVDQIAIVETSVLMQRADLLGIPTPHESGPDWKSLRDGSIVLTVAARAALRSRIRSDRIAAWDLRMRWLPLISALTGLLGAAIGVLAFFKK